MTRFEPLAFLLGATVVIVVIMAMVIVVTVHIVL